MAGALKQFAKRVLKEKTITTPGGDTHTVSGADNLLDNVSNFKNKIGDGFSSFTSAESSVLKSSAFQSASIGAVGGALSSIGQGDDSFLGSAIEGAIIGGIAGSVGQSRRTTRIASGHYSKELHSAKTNLKRVNDLTGQNSAKIKTNKADIKASQYFSSERRALKKSGKNLKERGFKLSEQQRSQQKKIDSNRKAMRNPDINPWVMGAGAGAATFAHNVLNGNNSI